MNLAKGFSDRNVAAGKTSFDLRWTNLMKATIHLAQDLRRISRTPSLIRIINAVEFCTTIEAAKQRDRIKKHGLEESVSLSKGVDTGKLKRENYWITWSRALKNYL